ncbi:MAG TPA: hypothetical protein VHZ51_11025 [Ktedonobacteraceae bacterium]|jgi:hypothetical protein|nr:hypothetical protein [Ktedonobacteraceae bacterium]
MPAQQRLGLDQEQRLLPRSDHPDEEYQAQSIHLPADGSFDLSMQNDQLLAQERVFSQQFGFASGQIGKSANDKRGCRRFDPIQETFLERKQARTNALLDQGKHTEHKWNLFFVKMGTWPKHTCRMTVLIVPASHALWQESLPIGYSRLDFLNGYPK